MVEKVKEHLRSKGTVLVTASSFPSNQWSEWDLDCKENYGDCRWMKMWSDHLNAKGNKQYTFLLKKYKEIDDRLVKLETGVGPKPEVGAVKTLGGTIKESE
ncbi:MAG: hypothetical protein ACW991_00685 [Candidatus Hodarchaeales archaeon]|jgi:hypothetical protein